MIGGAGNDTYYVDNAGDVVTENSNEGIDTVISNINNYILGANFENGIINVTTNNFTMTGNELNNSLTGGSGTNTLYGLAGNDTIFGANGNDKLYGDDGNDSLDGGSGTDTMYGGLGDDIYRVDATGDTITENLDEGIDLVQVNASISYTLAANVENLTLTSTTAVNGTGNASNNTITGNIGNNVLTGLAGNDTYVFSSGSAVDTVNDSAGSADEINFTGSVLKTNIGLFMSGSNLIIDYAASVNVDQITVQNQFTTPTERFELSNGEFLTDSDITQVVNGMAAYAAAHPEISFSNISDVRSSTELMNIIFNAWHT